MKKLFVVTMFVLTLAPALAVGQQDSDDGEGGNSGQSSTNLDDYKIVHFLPKKLDARKGSEGVALQLQRILEEKPNLKAKYEEALEKLGYSPGTTLFPLGWGYKLELIPPGWYDYATRIQHKVYSYDHATTILPKVYFHHTPVLRLSQGPAGSKVFIYIFVESGDLARLNELDPEANKEPKLDLKGLPGIDLKKTEQKKGGVQ